MKSWHPERGGWYELAWHEHYAAEQCLLARTIARVAHAGQMRAGLPPEQYFEHVRRVAASFAPGPEKCIAYLHDVLEDTKVRRGDLFWLGVDSSVVDAVIILTHEHSISSGQYALHIRRMRTWADEGTESAAWACAVKIADLRDNMGAVVRLHRIGQHQTAERLSLRYEAALEVLST